jgi:hypothetical protein
MPEFGHAGFISNGDKIMAVRYEKIPEELQTFMAAQKIFFVATATDSSRINLSPKGMDSLRILDANRVLWLNVTGSGNETAAHVETHPRMTLMFCAYEGDAMILRLFGTAKAVHQTDPEWDEVSVHFSPLLPGTRQIFDLHVDLVQTSCGMAVPFYTYEGEREELNDWARRKGESGIQKYWLQKNQHSLDGAETYIATKNIGSEGPSL